MKFKNEAESMLWALVYAAHINAGKLAGDFGPADEAVLAFRNRVPDEGLES
jgi:hypothetical protein